MGNDVRSSWRPLPGARARRRLVAALQRGFGPGFALYGRGWSGVGVRGPIGIDEVPQAYAKARVSIGIDHTVGPYQFSNRLPIALAVGAPLAYSTFAGSSSVLPGLPVGNSFRDPGEAVRVVRRLISSDATTLSRLAAVERALGESFACDAVLGYMLSCAGAILTGADPGRVVNSWLPDAHHRL